MRIFKHNQLQNYIKILDYTYTSQPSINSALPLQFSNIRLIIYIISCICTLGFVWLLAKWSPKKKAIMLYSVCQIKQATAFLILQQDVLSGSTIVPRRDRLDIKRRSNVISFCYHDRNFQYHQQKQVFLPIRYQDLGIQLDRLKKCKFQPYSRRSRKKLLEYYGYNQIILNVQSKLQLFIQEMLTPYQVFQLYAIILWVYQEYYIFAIMLLAYSLYTYWDISKEVVNNQIKLAQRSYFNTLCKIISKKKDDQNNSKDNKQNNKQNRNKISMQYKRNQHQHYNQQQNENENDSEDYTIIEQDQIRQNTQQNNNKKQINLSQQIPYKQNNNINLHIQSHSTYKSESQNSHPLQSLNKQSSNYNSTNNSHSSAYQKIQLLTTQSKNILPGDIIILNQGQIVPCDCIILSGQAIVDQSYISGQNYLIRKTCLQDYQYSKDREKGFILYLGTKIIKIKNQSSYKKQQNLSTLSQPFSQLSQKPLKALLQAKQIACLVTQTNYNTQRGKYLRAIRYQKKPTDNFTRQTIYFIYIILIITVTVFMALLPIVDEKQSDWDMFVMFLDMLATSIPITLPTALSVGINFAKKRLSKCGIHAILPSNILAGGRATTVVLDSNKVLSKNYQVSSIVVGIKGNQSIGNTYSSLSQFLDLTNSTKFSQSFYADPERKKQQIKNMHESGKMLLRAFATCHSLQKYNNELSGSTQERHLFQFCSGKYVDQDVYDCLGQTLRIRDRLYFKQKDKKLAVIVQLQKMSPIFYQQLIEQPVQKNQLLLMSKQSFNRTNSIESSNENKQKYIFIKGPVQKIIRICKQKTYPIDYHDYIVDLAQKGFKTLGYAYKKLPQNYNSTKSLQYIKQSFIFCGFALLEAQKLQDTIQTITQLKQAKMQLTLISQQRQLQTSSVAINNKLCTKNQLILCSLHHGRINCTGHMQWQSSGMGDDLNQFIMQSDTLTKNSHLSLNSKLYQELFMKRDQFSSQNIFRKSMIFNQMENRHIRNVYFQLERRNKVTFAVGSGASVSECAHLSMELQRGQCSMLSSFHTNQKSLKCITKCLIICRAALATNFHCFSMMILFALVQFTTVVNLYFRYQNLSDPQYLYQDLFVTFPIFVTINMTSPVSKLSKQLPPKSFFSGRALASMIGQFLIQLVTQIIFINYLFSLKVFRQEMLQAHQQYVQNKQFSQTSLTLATFILTNYLYLGIVLCTSVSGPFRKPFYTNPYYTFTLISLWFYNTAIVLLPQIVPQVIREKDLSQEVEEILVMAMLLGNLIMIVMYLYENVLVWIIGIINRVRISRPKSELQLPRMM